MFHMKHQREFLLALKWRKLFHVKHRSSRGLALLSQHRDARFFFQVESLQYRFRPASPFRGTANKQIAVFCQQALSALNRALCAAERTGSHDLVLHLVLRHFSGFFSWPVVHARIYAQPQHSPFKKVALLSRYIVEHPSGCRPLYAYRQGWQSPAAARIPAGNVGMLSKKRFESYAAELPRMLYFFGEVGIFADKAQFLGAP